MSETRQFLIFILVIITAMMSFWNLTETIRLRADLAASRALLSKLGEQ